MFDNYAENIENKLNEVLQPVDCEYSRIIDAMNYSTFAGGKRIRPKLMLEFMRISGGEPLKALNFAVALEMIHTYSLIHDDLPCMDNDDMRRGRPSCHKAFDETTALLAGDALLTEAFNVASATEGVEPKNIVNALNVLASCAGVHGMIGGQVIDLKYEKSQAPLEVVKELYRLKTGALLNAAASIGCILAGADDKKISAAVEFSEKIGLAFQIRDDILDIVGDEQSLGKPIGSDKTSGKSTYVSIVGLQSAQKDVEHLTNEAISALSVFEGEADNLIDFSKKLINRIN